MYLHLVLQTSFSYVLLHIMIQNERFEYFRSFLEESFGLNYVLVLYGAVLSLCFPVLLFLQNFLAAYVLNCFPNFANSRAFMKNIYADFYKKLDTNLTRSNTISIFKKTSTSWLICVAYFAYTLPMIFVIIFILFFDPKTSLCWPYRSTFLMNNERKGLSEQNYGFMLINSNAFVAGFCLRYLYGRSAAYKVKSRLSHTLYGKVKNCRKRIVSQSSTFSLSQLYSWAITIYFHLNISWIMKIVFCVPYSWSKNRACHESVLRPYR